MLEVFRKGFQLKDEYKVNLEAFSDTRKYGILFIFFLSLVLCAVLAMLMGAYDVSFTNVYATIFANINPYQDISGVSKLHNTIIWNIRLPRVLLAIAVGAALATSGAVFQGCFKNPLVEPYILGVSSGAAFGAALGIVYPEIFSSVQVAAFIFGSIAVLAAYMLARTRGQTPVVTLILGGIIIGSIFSALVSLLKYTADDSALREIVFWLMGGFYYATWNDVMITVPIVFVSFLIMWMYAWKLNILSMGDEEAKALGVNPERSKFIIISIATLVTAIAVSVVGIVAWVGLMMPHAARMTVGPDNRFVIPSAAMLGSIYLIVCDTMARTLTTSEIPVGIITSILGAPYLCYLLRNKGRSLLG
ncbi:iron ABC transporter permease [Methanolobus sp. ZRKC2]|uniref:FecCD family ABC transporter permease n=1 Tax=Methanolobus sp. ZRKC2 TaxID=3125783 RepID=UPI003245F293